MSEPDLTPERALALASQLSIRGGLTVIAFGFSVMVGAGLLAILVERVSQVPPLSTGLAAIAGVHGTLAIRKPALYWNSGSAIRARLRQSADAITRQTLLFDTVMVVIALVIAIR